MEPEIRQTYEFTTDWFSWAIHTWRRIFSNTGVLPQRAIEIGSYEGRSTVWIIENLLAGAGGSIVAIDSWAEGTEPDQRGMTEVEERFDRNMAIAKLCHPNVIIEKRKGKSSVLLSELIAGDLEGTFDFIYIDGNHQSPDVLTDLTLGFQLCRNGGLIFCDDYLWGMHRDATETPKLAIDSFLACFRYKVRVIPEPLLQIYLQKIVD